MAEERFYYVDAYSDEVVPCDCTLDGWAAWLSTPDIDWGHYEAPADGDSLPGYAMRMLPDIIATCSDGEWSLSRKPDGDFLAVRFGKGEGWGPDDIAEPSERGLLNHLHDYADEAGEVFVAVGVHENGWRFTYRAGPPPFLEAERST